jgi:hypothetical protein
MPRVFHKSKLLALVLVGAQLFPAVVGANATKSNLIPEPTASKAFPFHLGVVSEQKLDTWRWDTKAAATSVDEGLFSKTQLAPTLAPLSMAEVQRRLTVPKSFIDNFDAGFPNDLVWKPGNLVDDGEQGLGLRVAPNPVTAQRPLMGGSIQFWSPLPAHQASQEGRIFRYDAFLKLAPPTSGTVQTAFTFTVPWWAPRREIDFEFNGKTGRMECTIHLQPLNGRSSAGYGISVAVPKDAFTGFRKWSIVANADRIEWFYEGKLLARYVQKLGFDTTVQEFAPMKNGTKLVAGTRYIHPNDAGWHLSTNNFFLQHWGSRLYPDWIGSYKATSTELMRAKNIDITHFTNENTKFTTNDWTVQPINQSRSFSISIIRTNPANYGYVPTSIEYSVAGGPWLPLPSPRLGTQIVTNVASGIRRIRIRPVAASVNGDYRLIGDPSDEKIVVVSAPRA